MMILDRDNHKWFITQTKYDNGTVIYIIDHTGKMYRTDYLTPGKATDIERDIIGLNNQICWAELAFLFVKHNVEFQKSGIWFKGNV